MSAMSAMLELGELEPILGGNCMTPGPRPGRSQAGVIPIPKCLAFGACLSHITGAFSGISRYPPGMPKSLVFWSSPPKKFWISRENRKLFRDGLRKI